MNHELLLPHQYDHYYFQGHEDSSDIKEAYEKKVYKLLHCPVFQSVGQKDLQAVQRFLSDRYDLAESLFDPEEQARNSGDPTANLVYHGKPHLRQIAFDIPAIILKTIQTNPEAAKNWTPIGIISTLDQGPFHDTGYVTKDKLITNCAARLPIHVEESIKTATETIGDVNVPSYINQNMARFKALFYSGIYNTYFVFTPQHQQHLDEYYAQMSNQDGQEANELAKVVQLADFGGQIARIDQYPTLSQHLRTELETLQPGRGYQDIGEDHEMWQKTEGFIKAFVLSDITPCKMPSVGPTAKWLFGTKNHAFHKEWINQGLIRHELKDFHFCTLPNTTPFIL